MNELNRIEKMIGKDKLKLIENTSILIVGIGGVGGSSLEMLARCGVKNIIIVDFDYFEETNLNRQILSLRTNIGKSKVLEAKKRVNLINKNINVTCINIKLGEEIEGIVPKTDYIIDACDDVLAKVSLVKYAVKNNVKIISCCGTGNRLKPELLTITNIWKTEYDPLAKKLRSCLRKENINYKLPVVCSLEKPLITSKDTIGSVALVPNAAGILLASYVINDILR